MKAIKMEEKKLRTIVIGPKREPFNSYKLVEKILDTVPFKEQISEVLWNKDWGFSTRATEYFRGKGVPIRDYKINWKSGPPDENGFATQDNTAGQKVNGVMVRNADALIVVFLNETSFKLINDCVAQAKSAGLLIQGYIVNPKNLEFLQLPLYGLDKKEETKLDEVTEQYPATNVDGSEIAE